MAKQIVSMSAAKGAGSLLFLAGMAAATVGGIIFSIGQSQVSEQLVFNILLMCLGATVALLNVTSKEMKSFLMATAALVIISALGGAVLDKIVIIGQYIQGVLYSILAFVTPSAVIIALKYVYFIEKD